MKIVLDLQACQTPGSKNRGIGVYSWSLADAMISANTDHEFVVALNENFPREAENIRLQLKGRVAPNNFVGWKGPSPTESANPDNEFRRRVAEHLRCVAIDSAEGDFCHISSLFEGLVDNAIVSCDSRLRTPSGVTLYDVIPLQYSEIYLKDRAARDWYFRQVSSLKNCDRAFCISQNTRQEAVRSIGLNETQAVNISSAIDPDFKPRKYATSVKHRILANYGISQPFVLYTGGIDHRKNVDGMVTAFGSLQPHIRDSHQLVIVCKIDDATKEWLWDVGERAGLRREQLVLTGFVPHDDLIALYNFATLFVFPSWHEGFGLPALEAMACGTATIAANNSSLPEVIGCPDALFDPHSISSIVSKIEQALTDSGFHKMLREHSLIQAAKFSWEASAERVLNEIEHWKSGDLMASVTPDEVVPSIAIVTPFTPDASGIADYSVNLASALSELAEVTVVVQDGSEALHLDTPPFIKQILPESIFREKFVDFTYVVYQFGNSPFHTSMTDLIQEVPGVIDLHDFYLGHMHRHHDVTNGHPGYWSKQLYESHGYASLLDLEEQGILGEVVTTYPANWPAIKAADGVIVHSEYAEALLQKWYPEFPSNGTSSVVIPLPIDSNSESEFEKVDIPPGRWIASFGLINREKGYDRILQMFSESLAYKNGYSLAFVGQPVDADFRQELVDLAENLGIEQQRFLITDRVEKDVYEAWLRNADAAIQLRLATRGETSAAVLDCIRAGVPLLVNGLGSAAELPSDSVTIIPAEFSTSEFLASLDSLLTVESAEKAGAAQAWLSSKASPEVVARDYLKALKYFHARSPARLRDAAIASIMKDDAISLRLGDEDVANDVARAIAESFPDRRGQKQYFVDVTVLTITDARSGIQRVVRNVLKHLLVNGVQGFRVEPVYADGSGKYRYARKFTSEFLSVDAIPLPDHEIQYAGGDVFLGLDLVAHLIPSMEQWFLDMRNRGVRVQFVLYDMLPALHEDWFAADLVGHMTAWYRTISRVATDIIAISDTVAYELKSWLDKVQVDRDQPLRISSFPLGQDLDGNASSQGASENFDRMLEQINESPMFLMVGTVEPRKGHADAIEAFERVWASGEDAVLFIVGKQGWRVEELTDCIRSHPEFGRKLLWADMATDDDLSAAYARADFLLAASRGEGYGLPLIEAGSHGKRIIARDIPVFKEVAKDGAIYFDGNDLTDLSRVIEESIEKMRSNTLDAPGSIKGYSWQEATEFLVQSSLAEDSRIEWTAGRRIVVTPDDARVHSSIDQSKNAYLTTAGKEGYLHFGPYLTLEPGIYRVIMLGTCKRASNAWIDIVSEGGAAVHKTAHIADAVASLENHVLFDYNIALDTQTSDVEVRCWVDSGAALRVDGLIIERLENNEFLREI